MSKTYDPVTPQRVAFIGLGVMGGRMARRLLEHGYPLIVHDINAQAVKPLAKLGARVAKSPRDVANHARVVFASLPAPAVLREVALGEDGVARGKKTKILIDLSTTGSKVQQEVAASLQRTGITLIDAPVSGGATGAEKGALAVMVADCIPLLLKSDIAIAAVHVGRRGLMNQIARKTIAAMRDLGAEMIHAYIGPSICGNCYEVSAEIFDEVVSKYPSADASHRSGKLTLDLVAGLKEDLKDTVVLDLSSCVLEDSHTFSYRRDGTTGRQAGVIWR